MRSSTIAAFALTAISALPAIAADMPVKAIPPAPVFSWTGFYVGGNIGYGSGNAFNTFAFSQSSSANGFTSAGFQTLNATDSVGLSGLVGGGQVGYNWQVRQFLFGAETDFQSSRQNGSRVFGSNLVSTTANGFNPPGTTNAVAIAYTDSLNWFGTARGRVGYASSGVILYATGGVAYGNIGTTGLATPATPQVIAPAVNLPAVWSQSATKVGWTVGAGLEGMFANHWSWKVEYLYMDLGNITGNGAFPAGNCYGPPLLACNGPLSLAGPGTAQARFTENIVRFGVNYHFN